jgi:hypothetical protein
VIRKKCSMTSQPKLNMNRRLFLVLMLVLTVSSPGCSSVSRRSHESQASDSLDAKMKSFLAERLGVNLDQLPFGAPLENYPGATKGLEGYVRIPEEADSQWYELVKKSSNIRGPIKPQLRLRFRHAHLEEINVFLGYVFASKDAAVQSAAQDSMNKILAEFQEIAGGKLSYQGGGVQVRYNSLCSPADNFAATVSITKLTQQ